MAVNIVTGMTGIEHITSHDDRARNASQFGRGKYVFNIGRKFSATAVDDNLVRIQDGMCINQGTQMGIEPNDYADVEIDNGLLGTNRHDIIVMRYEKNEETLLEKASLAVVKGVNSSEPVDPDITEGNILDGNDLVDDMPLYRVVIEGVNLVSVEPLFEVFEGDVGSILEELGDKVDKVTGKGLSTNDYTNEDKAKVDDIPTKTSDLENDSDFVSDENYIHTDNNYTNEDKEDVKKIDDIENISVLSTSTVYEVTSIALYGGGMVEALNNESAISVKVGDYIYAKNDISKKFNFGYEVTKTLKAGYYRVKSVYSNGHAVICAINSSTVPDSTYGIVTITELEKSLVIEKMDIDGKVDKVDGKGLSTNDYTDDDKEDVAKIDDIEHSLSTTKTATGNPISISDSAHVNAEELTVELEPKQDLHGYDNPWVGGAGKNKLPLVNETRTYNGVTYTVNPDGTISARGTASGISYFILTNNLNDINDYGTVLLASGTEIIPSTNSTRTFRSRYTDGTYEILANDTPITLTKDVGLIFIEYSDTEVANDTIKPMIRLSAETDPTFEPYSNICPISGYDETSVVIKDTAENPTVTDTYTLQFGETVYGAEVDFVSGVATVKYGYADLGDLEWAVTDISGQFFAFVTTRYKAVPTSQRPNFICSEYSIGFPTYTDALPLNNGEVSSFANTANNNTIFARNTDYSNATDFKSAMQGVQLVYELATPYTIQLAPQQIKMLKGNNVLSADGDMDLTYQVDGVVGDVKEWAENEFLPKASATAQHNYSTQEQVVGTWIDGKPLYQKTFEKDITVSSFSRTWYTAISTSELALLNVNKIMIDSDHSFLEDSNGIYPVNYSSVVETAGGVVGGVYDKTSSSILLCIAGLEIATLQGVITIQYTKTVE